MKTSRCVAALIVSFGLFTTCAVHLAAAQTNPAPITVTAERIPTFGEERVAGDTAAGALESVPGVGVNSQGGVSAQSDLSIRGSSFSGAGLSLNGLALRNPQTEHFASELPVSPALFGEASVMTGLDQARGVDGHLLGTADFQIVSLTGQKRISLGGGEDAWNWQDAVLEWIAPELVGGRTFGAAVFGSREALDAVDYTDNDVERRGGGALLQAGGRDWRTDLLLAHQDKTFGARGYYGVNPDWYAEESLSDTLALLSARRGDVNGEYVRASAAWRLLRDDYDLFWTLPGVYANRHRSQVLSGAADGCRRLPAGFDLTWRLAGENEHLESNLLGDQERSRGALTLLPGWRTGPLRLTAGARGEVFTDDEPAVLPQAGLEYEIFSGHRLYGSYTESVRQPSFTELNYESPGSLGNSGLPRQEAQTVDAGLMGRVTRDLDWRAGVFFVRSRHTVDWAKPLPTSTRWEATDLGTVDTRGAEGRFDYTPQGPFGLQMSYAWLGKDSEADPYSSRYALDYPEHLLRVALCWRITSEFRLITTQTLRRQRENPLRTGNSSGVNGRIEARWTPAAREFVEITLLADNLWNDNYQVFPGQPASPRRVGGGLTLTW